MLAFTDIHDSIAAALKAGNSKTLATYFGSSLDLTIDDKNDLYSKAQSELIIKDFFEHHQPKAFKVIHSGTSKLGMEYAIGELTTDNGVFRVTYYLKKQADRKTIQQLRFSAED